MYVWIHETVSKKVSPALAYFFLARVDGIRIESNVILFFFILSPFFSRSSLLFFIFISWSDFEPLRKSAYRSFGEKRMSRISD